LQQRLVKPGRRFIKLPKVLLAVVGRKIFHAADLLEDDTTDLRATTASGVPGHLNYFGNEVYSLNLNANPRTLTRLTDPSVFDSDTMSCPDANVSDGTPVSRETYNGLVYLRSVDRMFSFDGSRAPCGGNSGSTWTLDLSATPPVWHAADPVSGFSPANSAVAGGGSVTGAICAYDPNTQSVFCDWGNQYELLQYTYANNTWKQLTGSAESIVPGASTAVIDPVRQLMLFIGDDYHAGVPKVMAIDISSGSAYAVQDWSSQVSGCSLLAGVDYPGLVYDPVLDKIVGWPGTGNTVYVFNPDTKTCVAQAFPNGPQNLTNNNGTFGRFQYFAALGAYAVVSDAGLDAFMLRLASNAVGWTVSGGGAISGSGSFSAGSVPGGAFTVSATAGGVTGSASVTLVNDTTPPSVSMTAPVEGSTVSGSVTLMANATDNVAVRQVQFLLDGSNLGGAVSGAGPLYSFAWDTTTLANGTHTLAAVATDAAGGTATSGVVSVTVSNSLGPRALLQLHADASEVSGVTNGSVVTPSTAPVGFTGTVVANGGGTVNFTPAQAANGVFFQNCCGNTNNAYYKFTGAAVGNIFNVSRGEISFYLKSRYSFAHRQASASEPRYAFDVRDGNGQHLFYFLTQVTSGYLISDAGDFRISEFNLPHSRRGSVLLSPTIYGGYDVRQRRELEGEDDVGWQRGESVFERYAGEVFVLHSAHGELDSRLRV
jgi:hypothetical protein